MNSPFGAKSTIVKSNPILMYQPILRNSIASTNKKLQLTNQTPDIPE